MGEEMLVAKVLVTGSEGLVGGAVLGELRAAGHDVVKLDLRAPSDERCDIRDLTAVTNLSASCHGIVHLAAVSRVAWAEREPDLCLDINVRGTQNVVTAAAASPMRPWLVFASSREVYGETSILPVRERDTPVRPVNVYGRSKAEGERLVLAAREQGLATAVIRFANVYGSTRDHADRVVPAFCRAAAEGAALTVTGRDHTFDFTHVEDVARGVMAAIDALVAGNRGLPPTHLATGQATTLWALAGLANQLGGNRGVVVEGPARAYDVSGFVGDPEQARRLLGWTAEVGLATGLSRLVGDFATLLAARADPGKPRPAAADLGLGALAASPGEGQRLSRSVRAPIG